MCHSNKNLKAEDRKIGSRLEREATTLTSNVVAPCRSMAKNSRNLSKAPGGSEFLQQIQTLCKQYDLLAKHIGCTSALQLLPTHKRSFVLRTMGPPLRRSLRACKTACSSKHSLSHSKRSAATTPPQETWRSNGPNSPIGTDRGPGKAGFSLKSQSASGLKSPKEICRRSSADLGPREA